MQMTERIHTAAVNTLLLYACQQAKNDNIKPVFYRHLFSGLADRRPIKYSTERNNKFYKNGKNKINF